MKYIVTTHEENVFETVVFVAEASSKEALKEEMIKFSKPYTDYMGYTVNENDPNHQSGNNSVDISMTKAFLRKTEFSIYMFACISDYDIYSVQEYLDKYNIDEKNIKDYEY